MFCTSEVESGGDELYAGYQIYIEILTNGKIHTTIPSSTGKQWRNKTGLYIYIYELKQNGIDNLYRRKKFWDP